MSPLKYNVTPVQLFVLWLYSVIFWGTTIAPGCNVLPLFPPARPPVHENGTEVSLAPECLESVPWQTRCTYVTQCHLWRPYVPLTCWCSHFIGSSPGRGVVQIDSSLPLLVCLWTSSWAMMLACGKFCLYFDTFRHICPMIPLFCYRHHSIFIFSYLSIFL